MTIPEFIRAKNKILKQYLGLDFDLTPEDQIEDIEVTKCLSIESTIKSCPYCVELDHSCHICPMSKAENQCGWDKNNTFGRYETHVLKNRLKLHSHQFSPAYKPMAELIHEYNTSNNLH